MDQKSTKKSLFSSKTLLPVLIILVNIGLVGILIWQYFTLKSPDLPQFRNSDSLVVPEYHMDQVRNHDYTLISPLRLTDVAFEFSGYNDMKKAISLYIQQMQKKGKISNASVYMRKMDDGSWMSINGNTSYPASSLFHVPYLICYLKLVENHSISLKHEFRFDPPEGQNFSQNNKDRSILAGRSYTLEDLLKYMIVDSDNNAAYVLGKNIDPSALEKVFTDLGLKKPQLENMRYSLTAIDYSRFFRVLYSATYLKEEYSAYALKLLTQCEYKEGIIKTLPSNTVIAHKFGEQRFDNEVELTESGIVYEGDKTYLLTVMTEGHDLNELPGIISEISKITFRGMTE